MPSTKLQTPKDYEELLDKFDTFLFDCDGVLWRGNEAIPGVPEAMNYIRSKGKQLLFVTNNSSVSRANYCKKFTKLGIEAHVDDIFSSAYAAAVYLKNVVAFPPEKKVYIIGQAGIQEELAAEGIRHSGAGDDNENMQEMDFSSIKPDPEVGAVLCGIDFHINYKKYAKAHTYLTKNPGCLFLLTNDDSTFPTEIGIFPGAGAISSTLITSTSRTPDAVLGKPNQTMMDCIIARYSLDLNRTLMIGDRLDTDIDFGNRGGLATLAVLTGVTTEQDLQNPTQKIVPTYYMESWGDLTKPTES
ncbi:HAD-like domain-containing protein [Endogone sp. FLAS-F59071]|nr:HAD-like domain-containing protein [Endogone sp. FLAS-F59071]|eukprot:RUS17126.1 HAD-like domain-containing protein [Endogone sp. FLAS-F59071]